jgi:septum formation protein
LKQIGVTPDQVLAADIDETPLKHEQPAAYVKRLACAKAAAIADAHPHAIVLAADTAVALGRRILPKAEDETTARNCLKTLSGRRHRVITAVAVQAPAAAMRCRAVSTLVKFAPLSEAMIEAYVESGEGLGKAGGYGIQGQAAAFVTFLSGSYSAVVGLPLYETRVLLKDL